MQTLANLYASGSQATPGGQASQTGPTAQWDAYKASRGDEAEEPDWAEFTAAFRENFVPAAIMKMKRDEFRTLRQDNLSDHANFQSMVNKALKSEVDNQRVEANRKRKAAAFQNK
ncbi:hypothetical protein E2562_017869 [Oryza meyeriana var. granulata]|uniref:Retrotransposon gag domain-containing protein n=1 Tax=Oryza meyeriana var. granulata TaxID=110450 RepID=A0A6G1E0E3_9ORYZ|nr:hypothetical protein E2562_017869 [Oryza meyeriana var. granulata]